MKQPVDTKYYDELQVPFDATQADIKKAYYKLAIIHHPDKNPSNKVEAELKFKCIGEAYQVLGDEDLRNKYDLHGLEACKPSNGFMDPKEVFQLIFGGEAFVPIIGTITLATMEELQSQDVSDQNDDDSFLLTEGITSATTIANRNKLAKQKKNELFIKKFKEKQKERIDELSFHLDKKLKLFTSNLYPYDEFIKYCEKEVEYLSKESYGPELLLCIGYIYSINAKQILCKKNFFGSISSCFHGFKETIHTVGTLSDVVGDGMKLKNEKDEISQELIMSFMWKLTAMDLESTLGQVCKKVLKESGGSGGRNELQYRTALALKILGDTYKGKKIK